MTVTGRGTVQAGGIVLAEPLALPEGTEVIVSVEVIGPRPGGAGPPAVTRFTDLPFFGMWADRENLEDSTAYVRKEREQWQHRALRQD
jgi:hypothetical protein